MFYKLGTGLILGTAALVATFYIAPYSFAGDNSQSKKEALDFAKSLVDNSSARLDEEKIDIKAPKISQESLDFAKTVVDGGHENLRSLKVGALNFAHKKEQVFDIEKIISGAKNIADKSRNNDEMPELLVFISLAMPKASILQLSNQVSKAGGVLVLRGMHKGSLKATVAKLMAFDKQGVDAAIDPIAFSNYQVQVVPTFVLRDKSVTASASIIDRMEGNVPLEYVLERFANEGSQKEIASKLLNKMKGQI